MQSHDLIAALLPVADALQRLDVRYFVTGSVASTAYGRVRTTQDVDLVAELAPRHAAPLVEALEAAYYANLQTISDAIVRRTCFNVIHLATSFKVDVFTIKDREYDQVTLERARERSIDEHDPSAKFFFPAPEDVVLSKLERYRLGDEVSQQQWQDVLAVMRLQRDVLDRAYLDQWAGELGIADLLARVSSEAEG